MVRMMQITAPFKIRWRISSVAIRNTFGAVSAPPALTQVFHELDQGGLEIFPGDAHVSDTHAYHAETFMIGYDGAKIPNDKSFESSFLMDCLFQCHVFHQIPFLHLCLGLLRF